MSELDQRKEIERLLSHRGKNANPFNVLVLDMENCETEQVNKSFRRIALLLHPDKCSLANATDAFHVAERAHKMLSNESVLAHLKRAYHKKKQDEESRSTQDDYAPRSSRTHVHPTTGSNGASDSNAAGEAVAFGSYSKLARTGLSTESQCADEIARLLRCKPTDYFVILDVDPTTCDVSDINRRYRRMAQALHPDKCKLPHVVEVFTIFERAHKELSDEEKLVRHKINYDHQRKVRAARLAEELQRQHEQPTSSVAGLSADEQLRARKREAVREHQLEAVRLADEAERKKRKVEKQETEQAELAAELERQRKEWRDFRVF